MTKQRQRPHRMSPPMRQLGIMICIRKDNLQRRTSDIPSCFVTECLGCMLRSPLKCSNRQMMTLLKFWHTVTWYGAMHKNITQCIPTQISIRTKTTCEKSVIALPAEAGLYPESLVFHPWYFQVRLEKTISGALESHCWSGKTEGAIRTNFPVLGWGQCSSADKGTNIPLPRGALHDYCFTTGCRTCPIATAMSVLKCWLGLPLNR